MMHVLDSGVVEFQRRNIAPFPTFPVGFLFFLNFLWLFSCYISPPFRHRYYSRCALSWCNRAYFKLPRFCLQRSAMDPFRLITALADSSSLIAGILDCLFSYVIRPWTRMYDFWRRSGRLSSGIRLCASCDTLRAAWIVVVHGCNARSLLVFYFIFYYYIFTMLLLELSALLSIMCPRLISFCLSLAMRGLISLADGVADTDGGIYSAADQFLCTVHS